MNIRSHALAVMLIVTSLAAHSETALEKYQDYLGEASVSPQAVLLMKLTMDDCRIVVGVENERILEARIDRARLQGLKGFDDWERRFRERYSWCDGLPAFVGREDYGAQQIRLLDRAVEGGSALASLIHWDYRSMDYLVRRGRANAVPESTDAVFPIATLRLALIEAFDHGDPRLKQAAILEVHQKLRSDEAVALGMSNSQPLTLNRPGFVGGSIP